MLINLCIFAKSFEYFNTFTMKKVVLGLLAVLAVCFVLESCAHKTCDAYSSVNHQPREILR
jgi:hypothetical protein